jgi:hypothetical protein
MPLLLVHRQNHFLQQRLPFPGLWILQENQRKQRYEDGRGGHEEGEEGGSKAAGHSGEGEGRSDGRAEGDNEAEGRGKEGEYVQREKKNQNQGRKRKERDEGDEERTPHKKMEGCIRSKSWDPLQQNGSTAETDAVKMMALMER